MQNKLEVKKIRKKTLQEWLPIQKIYDDGIVKTKDNRLIKIIKINPINYNLKSDLEKEAILNSYKIFLKTCNFDIQILIQSNKRDLTPHIKNIQKNISKKENKYLKEISKYDITKKTLNGLKAFFQLTYENNPRFQRDIILFLRKCNCRLADEIKKFIEKKLSLQTSEKIRIESSEKSESNGGSETSLNKKILE